MGRMSDAPLEQGEFKRGPGGRPTREEAERRHRSLLATAFRLFLEKGWDGVSVEEISRQSGVAKGFIYARYTDKGALFVEALERLMADARGTLHLAEPLPDDVEQGLYAFGRKLLDLVLQPEALAFHRQFIACSGRFSGFAKLFLARNRVRTLLDLVLQPEALAFHRQFIAAAGRFPEFAKLFLTSNRVRDLIVEVLQIY